MHRFATRGRSVVSSGVAAYHQWMVPTIEWQPDAIVNYYAARCRALMFPGEEDFGMAPLEANAAGRPVIAYRGGGAVETVEEGVTGVFFDRANSQSMAEAIEKFEGLRWNQYTLRSHAEKFDRTVFAFRVLQFLGSVAPASCSTVASMVMARHASSRAHSRTRSASGARSGSVPSRAAAPSRSHREPTYHCPASCLLTCWGRRAASNLAVGRGSAS